MVSFKPVLKALFLERPAISLYNLFWCIPSTPPLIKGFILKKGQGNVHITIFKNLKQL